MKDNKNIESHLYNGQTILISGVKSSYYPKGLINKIKQSEVTDLTLIYLGNNDERDPFGDPMDLIYNGQVTKLITSHLGELDKTFNEHLEEIEILPMDILSFKIQVGAQHIPGKGGIYVSKEYAELYRDQEYMSKYGFTLPNGDEVVLEKPFNPDLSIVSVDEIDLDTFHCSFTGGTSFNCIESAKTGNMCFVEYHNKVLGMNPDDVDIPGQYIDGAIKSNVCNY